MQTNPPSWRTALRVGDEIIVGRVGEPHLNLLQRTLDEGKGGELTDLGFVDEAGRFCHRADALATCGAANGFTMGYPTMLRRFITWAERRPVRYLYAALLGSCVLLGSLIVYCEVLA